MKRKLLITLLVITTIGISLALSSCGGGDDTGKASWPAMDTLSELDASDIASIDYARMTEGGGRSGTISDATQVEDVYLRLKEVKVKDETDMAVDDDGLSLVVHTGDKDIGFTFEGDILVLESGGRYEVDNLGSLKSYIDGIDENGNKTEEKANTEENGDSAGPSEAMHDASEYKETSGSKDYDVSKGFEKKAEGDIEYLYFNDFMITMPNNDKWSFDMNGNAVTFYLFSAQQEGYGGRLVTVKAYDMDDKSYEQMPMPFQVAGVGKNANKRFVAIYPSDVQYNFNDKTQSADYKELYDYLKKIGEGAVNSPLQTSDSNPEP